MERLRKCDLGVWVLEDLYHGDRLAMGLSISAWHVQRDVSKGEI